MKLNTEIKTAHLLTGIGLCILLGLLLAYLLTPRLFTNNATVIDETSDAYKLPDANNSTNKSKLNLPTKPE